MFEMIFFGTCSGTEPMKNMHHCAWAIKKDDGYYWFDAGENCAHRAHTSGINVMNTIAIFVSHPHIDHIGGLANLLTCFHKLIRMHKKQFVRDNTLEIYFPDLPLLQYIKEIAYSGRGVKLRYTLNEHPMQDGLLFEDENIRVTAIHNRHMKEDGSDGWHAFSFLLEAEGKKIVFSGDVLSPDELLPLIGTGCDLLIMETGHHDVASVMDFAVAHNVKNLRLTHHGRQIIENRAHYENLAHKYTQSGSINITLCYDGMTEEF